MHKVSIKPQWTISDAHGHNLAPRLLELLAEVCDGKSIRCKVIAGTSISDRERTSA